MIRAVLILGAAAGRAMKDRRAGTIINVSSTSGFIAMGSYSAIKAWVTAYSEGLAGELAGTGVTVTALCPGWVRTEFHERASIGAGSIPEPMWLDLDEWSANACPTRPRGKVDLIPSRRYQVPDVRASVTCPAAGLAPRPADDVGPTLRPDPSCGALRGARTASASETDRLSRVSSRSRYTSPLHAGARFVAQRGLLKPLIWRLATVTVLGREHLEGLAARSSWCPTTPATSTRR